MAVREIVIYPDDILKKKCQTVEKFDDELKVLVEDMAETMYAAPGVGLAANQVGVDAQVCVIDVAEGEECELHVFVNPEIIAREGDIEWEEGCLSFPEMLVNVNRSRQVTVRAQDVAGNTFDLTAENLFAVAIQHELDHLNGVSLADKVGYLRKKMMLKELVKIKKIRQSAQ
ncbi:MAG: peptide deformylase [Deltaproteobacteria bacterium]|nr:peptide deformylase [Deltaproteobacteria bacterium]MBN2673256.1 peptide deformylase [Deltaproteobacteria bacterium]